MIGFHNTTATDSDKDPKPNTETSSAADVIVKWTVGNTTLLVACSDVVWTPSSPGYVISEPDPTSTEPPEPEPSWSVWLKKLARRKVLQTRPRFARPDHVKRKRRSPFLRWHPPVREPP